MRYWVFQNNQVTGPFDPDDLPTLGGYCAETLVCSEGRKGTNMGDWQRASMVPELSVSLLKVSQLATVLKGGGSLMGGLPPEPTLKDLAALGSLQERVELLDNTVGQLQENLKLKDTELLSVHRDLVEKDQLSKQLGMKLGELEQRLSAVNSLQEGLDKAVAAEHDVESTVERQAKIIEDLTKQLSDLQAEKARLEGAMTSLAGKQDLEEVKAGLQQQVTAELDALEKVQADIKEIKERPAPLAPIMPAALETKPAAAPVPLDTSPSGLAPFAATAPSPVPMSPSLAPLEGLGVSPVPEIKAEAAPSLGLSPSPIPETVPPAAAVKSPPAVAGAPAVKKKPNIFLFIVLALGALGAFAALKLAGRKTKRAAAAQSAPLPPPMPVPSPAPAMPATPPPPPAPSPEAVLEDKKKQAIALVAGWPGPEGKTLGDLLSADAAAANSSLSPWMAEPLHDDVFQVNYFSQKPGLPSQTYEFEADLAANHVSAHNAPAQDLLTAKPARAPRRRHKAHPKAKAKAAASAAQDKPLLEDLLVVNPDDDQSAAQTTGAALPAAKKRKSRIKPANTDQDLDSLLSGASEPAPKPKVKPKDEAAQPAQAAQPPQESLDDLLVPGGSQTDGLSQPQANPAEPSDDGAAQQQPPPKKSADSGSNQIDDLLKP